MSSLIPSRPLNEGELRLVLALLRRAGDQYDGLARGLADAHVVPLADGGMGSLEFVYSTGRAPVGEYGIATLTFSDSRGTRVSAALHTNAGGELFELDMFTADSSELGEIPMRFD